MCTFSYLHRQYTIGNLKNEFSHAAHTYLGRVEEEPEKDSNRRGDYQDCSEGLHMKISLLHNVLHQAQVPQTIGNEGCKDLYAL